ncbi:MAG TPA: oligopeptide/dipeptide ABC transporter ATP-binding protein, partial [Gaiellales bacterium]|nr:oligopeptide/dipeptide ABC transporter ATP-binding protein [Gaiellales bacterium]
AAGGVPDLADPPPGCRFAPRCPVRMDACSEVPPPVLSEPGHATSCWYAAQQGAPA